jgi:cytochrome P450
VKLAVDEVLRFESPAQYIARTCLEDFEWEGNQFKKDITVILLLASANRDEQAFPDPARFDITRSPNPHLSFGRGKHSCLGSNLVELELAAILTALRKKFSGFELIGEIKWQNRTGHRWMEEARFRAQLTE